RTRQGASRNDDRQLSVLRRQARPQHQYRRWLARSGAARRSQGRGRDHARQGQRGALSLARRGAKGCFMPQPLPEKAFPVSWDAFHRDARALAWRLADAGPFIAIVCVTRGGLVPAAIVARELGIRLIETVCVASYNYTSQGELKVLKDVARSIVAVGGGGGKGVLIVDDLVDTGK